MQVRRLLGYYGELMMGAHADPKKCNADEVPPFEADDGLHIRYVNCHGQKDLGTLIGRLIHDLLSTTSKGMYFPNLAEALRDCKETKEGSKKMESVIEAYIAVGEAKGKRAAALNFLSMGLSPEQVARGAELPLDEVEALKAEAAAKAPTLQ